MKHQVLRRMGALALSLAMLVSLSLPALAAEEGGGETPPAEEEQKNLTAEMDQKTLELDINKGTSPLKVTAKDAAGKDVTASATVTWATTDPNVVTVAGGVVTPVGTGSATVTATVKVGADTAACTCAVTVIQPVTGVTIARREVQFDRTDPPTLRLSATVSPSDATFDSVTWESEDPAVVTVEKFNDTGTLALVSSAGAGETTVRATVDGKTSECKVIVSGIRLEKTTLTLVQGRSEYLSLEGTYGKANDTREIDWMAVDSSVVGVDANGRVTARAIGTTIITADRGGYTATCAVTVVENTTGLVQAGSVSAGSPLNLSDLSSKLNTVSTEAVEAGLSYLTNLSVPTEEGVLYYGYLSEGDTGAGVGMTEQYYLSPGNGQRDLNGVSFVPRSDFSGTAEIHYTGVSATNQSFSGIIRVTVDSMEGISYVSPTGGPVTFQTNDFNVICRSKTGRDLNYVTFTVPASSRGTLYYNYTGQSQYTELVSSGTQYRRTGNPALDSVTFVPAEGYSGTVTVGYRGVDTNGGTHSGTVTIEVGRNPGSGDNISYTTSVGQTVRFQAADFQDMCRSATGRSLDYVRFNDLPPSAEGTLYYNYSGSSSRGTAVTGSTHCTSLSRVAFVPRSGFSGTVTIGFTGYDTNGDRFTGTVTIRVGSGDGTGTGSLRYQVRAGSSVRFDADDFNDACRDATGSNLSYVRFTLPSSSRGTLYYRRGSSTSSSVSANTSYYRSGSSRLIDDVSFTASASYNGTVTIDFTGYSVNDERFTGVITITVGEGSGFDDDDNYNDSDLSYRTQDGNPVYFDAEDFNDASRRATGSNLNYVRFTLPSSSRGTLQYHPGSGSATAVTANASYYRNSGSRRLDDVYFLPASGYAGTVTISYTGYAVNGDRFTGSISIAVDVEEYSSVRLSYQVRGGSSVYFDAEDFNNACRRSTGANLNYIRFNQTATGYGTLQYRYGTLTGSEVSTGLSYYRSGGGLQIGNVSFVAGSYNGATEISFTGVNVNGGRFDGTVRIEISQPAVSTLQYSGDDAPIPFYGSAFRQVCVTALGEELSGVRFTSLPPAASGRLYYAYSGPGTGVQVVLGNTYHYTGTPNLNQLSFVPVPGYQGTVTLAYAATGVSGAQVNGTVTLTLSGRVSSSFGDMGNYPWAVSAVEYLYRNGVVNGKGEGRFGPEQNINRCDFVVMLCRAFAIPGGGNSGFDDVPADSYYAPAVAAARERGIVFGDGNSFNPNGQLTRQDAMVMLRNAMVSAGWSLGDGNSVNLSGFADSGEIAAYARNAVGTFVQMGAVSGDSSGRLNPRVPITRADAALLLYAVMTR